MGGLSSGRDALLAVFTLCVSFCVGEIGVLIYGL